MNICVFADWPKSKKCSICGRVININLKNAPICKCIVSCRFLGEEKRQIKALCCNREEVNQLVCGCIIHYRCLPNYKPKGKELKVWLDRPESKMYHLCAGCTDFKPKND